MSKLDQILDLQVDVDEIDNEVSALRQTIQEIEGEIAQLIQGAENLLEQANEIADNANHETEDECLALDQEREELRTAVERIKDI